MFVMILDGVEHIAALTGDTDVGAPGVVEVAMRSDATTVARYIAEQPKQWQPTLKLLRAACKKRLPGYIEGIAHGMPSYARAGQIEVGFAKQARHLSLYVMKQPVFEAHRSELAGLSLGKGCIRYRQPEQVDWAIVSRLLADTYASSDRIC
jgi:uncharacterized protein YdhG (YjbR/CyaY superfamily)